MWWWLVVPQGPLLLSAPPQQQAMAFPMYGEDECRTRVDPAEGSYCVKIFDN
jgi:hypothetical protein